MKKAIILWFAFLFTILLMTSCGSRKVERNKEKEKLELESIVKVDENTKKTLDTQSNVKTVTTKETDEKTGERVETITEEPIDPLKPSIIVDSKGNRTELTNAKKTTVIRTVLSDKKEKEIKDIDSGVKVSQIEEKHAVSTSNQKLSTSKEGERAKIERKQSYWWLLWFLLLIPAYYLYKKIPFS